MSVIDEILQYKPLGSWQQKVFDEGRTCEKCGRFANITAPITDNDRMLRISCPNCGNFKYEFPEDNETIFIDFQSIERV